jgi:hypothetical protein
MSTQDQPQDLAARLDEGYLIDVLAELTKVSTETLENDADLVIWRVLPAGLGPNLPDESLGLLC